MQIRARVADSLIHVRGLWFRAMRTAAYTRGIKEFVLEFCSARGALYNVTRAGYAFPSILSLSFSLSRSLFGSAVYSFSFARVSSRASAAPPCGQHPSPAKSRWK